MLIFGDAFEAMGTTAFQALVAAVVVRAHPEARCFPLQGRDGGRDIVIPSFTPSTRKSQDAVVFQVKSRQPSPPGTPTTDELFSWLKSQLRRELPKIERLRERGIAEYVFVTNIAGSGDLHDGLQDRWLEYLQAQVPVPARTWWREDIETRLRAYPDIAAGFGLLRGEEGLRALVGSRKISAGGLAVSTTPAVIQALLAFCRHQYEDEGRLRFRQVDLENLDLLDVYLDVPAVQKFPMLFADHVFHNARFIVEDAPDEAAESEAVEGLEADQAEDEEPLVSEAVRGGYGYAYGVRSSAVPATQLFLGAQEPHGTNHILLEGAPGQGKSTVTQYVCQVHRCRILDRKLDLRKVPQKLLFAPSRLPLRIELRRYATWRAQQADPEAAGILSYLAALIQTSTEITVSTPELVEVLSATPSFIALDGLDEVPDLDVREEVVKAIEKLTASLEAWEADAKILLTSRPSTLLRAPKVSDKTFDRFVLQDLYGQLITDYAETWMRLKRLPHEEAETMRQVLAVNLQSPHIAELARNPMQLAILLWLINTRGWSLPDKRSALYDAYIDTFLTREAEKSPVVRDNRELLIELHGYIAWLLHSRSERSGRGVNAGDIDRGDLNTVIEEFLLKEDRDPSIFRELFRGVQRVFVLVERQEGRFEFAVQPIREYFAARYLYSTSPQVPANADIRGTRPDRLEALIRRPYWSNATRFFCGWYQKGELADLTRRLSDLASSSDLAATFFPRQLIERILADFSVAASRRDTEALAGVLCDLTGLRMLADSRRSEHRTNTLTPDTGRLTLVAKTKAYLEVDQPDEILVELAALLRATGSEVAEWWWDRCPQNPVATNPVTFGMYKWMRIGILSGAFRQLGLHQALQLYAVDDDSPKDWLRCIEAGRDDVLLHDSARIECALETLGDDGFSIVSGSGELSQVSVIANLAQHLSTEYWVHIRFAFGKRSREFDKFWARFPPLPDDGFESLPPSLQRLYEAITPSGQAASEFPDWWSAAVAEVAKVLGSGWTAWRIAICGANVRRRRPTETMSAVDLFNRDIPLVDRVHRASLSYELHDRWINWYRQAGDAAISDAERKALVCLSLLWASRESLACALPLASAWWACFSERDLLEMEAFLRAVSATSYLGRRKPATLSTRDADWLKTLPASLLTLLFVRYDFVPDWLYSTLSECEVSEAERTLVSGHLLAYELRRFSRSGSTTAVLKRIRLLHSAARYRTVARYDPRLTSDYLTARMRLPAAKHVVEEQDHYPWVLVVAAAQRLARPIGAALPTLGEVAEEERWFAAE